MGAIINVTPAEPCAICGKPDWCFRKPSQNGVLHYCPRCKDPEVNSKGEIYYLVRTTKDGFGVYEAESQNKAAREAYIAELKAKNPNYKPSKGKKAYKKPAATPTTAKYIDRSEYKVEYNLPSDDGKVLNKVYRTFLDCLVLIDRHKKVLTDEWGEDIFNQIISRYPIKSLPMDDGPRFKYGAYSESPWRKAVMAEMLDRGVTSEELSHTPMFLQVGEGEDERWTFSGLSGIIFPVLNPNGEIIRLRVRDDFPSAVGVFEGKEGAFRFIRDGWYFKAKEGNSEPILVYQPKSKTYKVHLDKNGVPLSDGDKKSKVSGKYKNLSSFKEIYDDENKVVRNRYKNGSQSGSYPSLYCKPTDDFTVVYFTEGEKKAMVTNLILGSPCVSFPGVGTFRTAFEARCCDKSIVDYCLQKGMKKAILCYDADKSHNTAVLQQEINCVKFFIENKIEINIGSWTESLGKGLDDVLLNGVRPTLHKVV